MQSKQVNKIVEARLQRIRQLLVSKGNEYVRGDDRLVNFKRMALLAKNSPEEALLGVAGKHLISIVDMIVDVREGRKNSLEKWDEKIGDAMVYLALLECIVKEESDES